MNEQPVETVSIEEWERQQPLLQRHPWYDRMNHETRWLRWRAILDAMEEEGQKDCFLPRAKFELETTYDFRKKISHFFGMAESACDQIVGSVFSRDPHIDAPKLKEFVENCDGARTALTALFESASKEALAMGASFILVDGAGAAPLPTGASRKDEQSDSERNKAFACQIRPEEVINWDHDGSGALAWVAVRRIIHRQSAADVSRDFYLELSIYDPNEVKRFEVKIEPDRKSIKKGAVLVPVELANPKHNIGEVPIYPIYGRRIGQFMGEPITKGAARADIGAFNNSSWLEMALYRHAHPILALTSDEEADKIFVSGNIVRLKPNEKLAYVEATGAAFDAREKAIERYGKAAISQTGMNPGATADSANSAGASGIAMRVRFTQSQLRMIEEHKRNVVRALASVLQTAAKFMGGTEADVREVKLNPQVDFNDAATTTKNLRDAELFVDSPTFTKEAKKAAVMAVMADADEKILSEIKAEIDKAQPKARVDVGA